MNRPSMNDILKNGESYYSLVIGIAKRAREIIDEEIEQDQPSSDNPVAEAVEEFADRKYVLREPDEIGSEK